MKKFGLSIKDIKFILPAIVLMAIAVCWSLSSQQYSTADITADTYQDILTESNSENIFRSHADKILGDEHVILTKDAIKAYGYEIVHEVGAKGMPLATIRNIQKNIEYSILWRDKSPLSADAKLFSVIMLDYNPSPLMKAGIHNLILNHGFILKRTNHINGSDIIVAETNTSFIIGKLIFRYDIGVSGIYFRAYKKRKYFPFL